MLKLETKLSISLTPSKYNIWYDVGIIIKYVKKNNIMQI